MHAYMHFIHHVDKYNSTHVIHNNDQNINGTQNNTTHYNTLCMSSLAPEAVELGKVSASNPLRTLHVTMASHFTHNNIATLFMSSSQVRNTNVHTFWSYPKEGD